jgi:hypothetical protein
MCPTFILREKGYVCEPARHGDLLLARAVFALLQVLKLLRDQYVLEFAKSFLDDSHIRVKRAPLAHGGSGRIDEGQHYNFYGKDFEGSPAFDIPPFTLSTPPIPVLFSLAHEADPILEDFHRLASAVVRIEQANARAERAEAETRESQRRSAQIRAGNQVLQLLVS